MGTSQGFGLSPRRQAGPSLAQLLPVCKSLTPLSWCPSACSLGSWSSFSTKTWAPLISLPAGALTHIHHTQTKYLCIFWQWLKFARGHSEWRSALGSLQDGPQWPPPSRNSHPNSPCPHSTSGSAQHGACFSLCSSPSPPPLMLSLPHINKS